MKCRTHSGLIVLAAAVASLTSASLLGAESRRPNVVLILTDNHGPWTLGCYGNREIRTPNIDRLASQGTLFTRCYSSNAVCSPTRATLLTGLIPSQHGVHCFLGAGGAQIGAGRLLHDRRVPHAPQDSGRSRLHVRPERQMAPGR